MLYIAFRVAGYLGFAHLLRYAQEHTPRPLRVMAVNYLVGVLLCLGWALLGGGGRLHSAALAWGAAAGVTYVTSLLFFLPAIRSSGIAIAGTGLQLAMVIPVAVSVLHLGETPSLTQAAGLAMAMPALPMLVLGHSDGLRSGPKRLTPWVGLLFLSSGLSQTAFKEFSHLGLAGERPYFSLTLFAVAALLTLACTGIWERRPQETPAASRGHWLARLWVAGSLLGTLNVGQLWMLLLALAVLPGIVVFPVVACLSVGLNVVVARILWGERPKPIAWVGIALATAAVGLLAG